MALPESPGTSPRRRVERIVAALVELGHRPRHFRDPNSKIETLELPHLRLRIVPYAPRTPCADASADAQALFHDEPAVLTAQLEALDAAFRACLPVGVTTNAAPYLHELGLFADVTGPRFTPEDRLRFLTRSRRRPDVRGADDGLTLNLGFRVQVYGKDAETRDRPRKAWVRPVWVRLGYRPGLDPGPWRIGLTFRDGDFVRLGTATDRTRLWRWGLEQEWFFVVPPGRTVRDVNRARFPVDPIWNLLRGLDFPSAAGGGVLPQPRPPSRDTPEHVLRTAPPCIASLLAAVDIERLEREGVRSSDTADAVRYLQRTRAGFDDAFRAKRRVYEARHGWIRGAAPSPPSP